MAVVPLPTGWYEIVVMLPRASVDAVQVAQGVRVHAAVGVSIRCAIADRVEDRTAEAPATSSVIVVRPSFG